MVICKAYGVDHDLATASRVEDLARSANGYREGPRKAKAIPSRKAVSKKVSDVPPGEVLDCLQLSVKPPRPPGQGGFPLFFLLWEMKLRKPWGGRGRGHSVGPGTRPLAHERLVAGPNNAGHSYVRRHQIAPNMFICLAMAQSLAGLLQYMNTPATTAGFPSQHVD